MKCGGLCIESPWVSRHLGLMSPLSESVKRCNMKHYHSAKHDPDNRNHTDKNCHLARNVIQWCQCRRCEECG